MWWWFTTTQSEKSKSVSSATAVIQHVVDGDTVYVLLEGKGTKVRLLNVSAPEVAHMEIPAQCYGNEATEFLTQKLPKGSIVELDFDVERFDKYGRVLASITYKDEFINESMISSGHATAMKVKPNVKHYEQLRAAQKLAERLKVGLYDPDNGCRCASGRHTAMHE
ncbi:hypothetical protein CQ018_17520 [Arthrobacter sp. MYb227]|uniref:thermonuclease family protein n=1 Tax=Arthrobacter sp. MYb227 TaxID=1848601 RepID=UPI000CFB327B|nr:thermonuclease family protein [Arthrobacter sp. MYb227]PQZ87743.1 hypothetical protein CQ018_17520 [Arthrobacter sp. MYb227]